MEHEDLYWQMTTEVGNAAIDAAYSAYAYFPQPYAEAKEQAVMEAEVEAGDNLLRLVAFATLIARPRLAVAGHHPISATLAGAAAYERIMRAKVLTVEPLVKNLLQWKATKDHSSVQHTAHYA